MEEVSREELERQVLHWKGLVDASVYREAARTRYLRVKVRDALRGSRWTEEAIRGFLDDVIGREP